MVHWCVNFGQWQQFSFYVKCIFQWKWWKCVTDQCSVLCALIGSIFRACLSLWVSVRCTVRTNPNIWNRILCRAADVDRRPVHDEGVCRNSAQIRIAEHTLPACALLFESDDGMQKLGTMSGMDFDRYQSKFAVRTINQSLQSRRDLKWLGKLWLLIQRFFAQSASANVHRLWYGQVGILLR